MHRILEATRWRLVEVYGGDSYQNEKEDPVFSPSYLAGSSWSSAGGGRRTSSRWMLPPYVPHIYKHPPPALFSTSNLSRGSFSPAGFSSSLHACESPPPITTGGTTDPTTASPRTKKETADEEGSSACPPSGPQTSFTERLSYPQSLLAQGTTSWERQDQSPSLSVP